MFSFDTRLVKPMSDTSNPRTDWQWVEVGPPDPRHTVLLLPGGLCTSAFFEDLMSGGALEAASVRMVAVTLPGFGGTKPLGDPSFEGWVDACADLAADLGCDAVVGHSVGANVALEMAASHRFDGPVLLLAPSCSRVDESMFLRVLDRTSTVLGSLPYALALRMMGVAMKGAFPAERHDALAAQMKHNDPKFVRSSSRSYLRYLDRNGSLVPRLCESGTRATIVLGDEDDVGLTDAERAEIEACETLSFVAIPEAGHFTLNQRPDRVADLLLELLNG
jgi:pimeloyl-ACP methyl ester carboxylesterase